nr:M13 family metallopeptidase [uncultured Holophaga sp.]
MKKLTFSLTLLASVPGILAAAAPAARADILARDLDPGVSPGVDFFNYANGGWLKRNPIPASESSWGIGDLVEEELRTRLRRINEDAVAHPTAAPETRKVGDFWVTAMDEARCDRLGLAPLQPELDRLDRAHTLAEVMDVAFAWRPLSVRGFFSVSVGQDDKKSDEMAVFISQGGLSLPERDFYFNPEPGVVRIRQAFVEHCTRLLVLTGRPEAEARKAAEAVMAFETELAQASRKMEDLRDPWKNYHRMSPGEVSAQLTPGLDWKARLGSLGLQASSVVVGQPEYLKALEPILARTPVPVLKDYLRLGLVMTYADFMSKSFQEEYFRFNGQVLSGQQQPRERWKRVLDVQGACMGMVLGKVFAQAYFPEATKQRYLTLVEAIRQAYRERIQRLDWMSPETKAKALVKLDRMDRKVGYPDKWKDYSALVVNRESYCGNVMNAMRWRFQDMVSKYGKPVDRTEWNMTPQTYNAYYEPANNEIVLPAAIFMVPGVPDAELDDALVYGYVGASTIGHEITHGFDDQGRQYDAQGNLNDWWTPEDAARFKARAEVMVKQFNAYEPIPGLHINGQASLGENIADLGGLLLGLDAFKKTEQYRKGEKIAGLTPLQRYFLGYSLGWLYQQREEELRSRLLSDVHAPAKWRVLGPMSNMPEFYEAFGVKAGQPLWRPEAERVHIW